MDPNEQPPSMPDAPDKEKMEQVSLTYYSEMAAVAMLRRIIETG